MTKMFSKTSLKQLMMRNKKMAASCFEITRDALMKSQFEAVKIECIGSKIDDAIVKLFVAVLEMVL